MKGVKKEVRRRNISTRGEKEIFNRFLPMIIPKKRVFCGEKEENNLLEVSLRKSLPKKKKRNKHPRGNGGGEKPAKNTEKTL